MRHAVRFDELPGPDGPRHEEDSRRIAAFRTGHAGQGDLEMKGCVASGRQRDRRREDRLHSVIQPVARTGEDQLAVGNPCVW